MSSRIGIGKRTGKNTGKLLVGSTKESKVKKSIESRRGTKRQHNNITELSTETSKPTLINPCNKQNQSNRNDLGKFLSSNNIERGSKNIFDCIIINNSYVDVCVRNTQRDNNSFYSLIKRDLSHSDAIKLGIAIEKIFVDIILTNPQIKNMREHTKKGKKETDHLFLNTTTNTLYYAEVKGNLQLDTEKRPATIKKIQDITEKLKMEGNNVKSFLFAPRYFSTSKISQELIASYNGVNVIGVNEYLAELGIDYRFENEQAYADKLNYLAHRMFECISFKEIEKLELERDKTALGESFLPEIPTAPKKPFSAISRLSIESEPSPSRFQNPSKKINIPVIPKQLSF